MKINLANPRSLNKFTAPKTSVSEAPSTDSGKGINKAYLRDTLAISTSSAGVAAAAAGIVSAVGLGALAATAVAVPLAMVGAFAGAALTLVGEEAFGGLMGMKADYDMSGSIVIGGATGAIAAAGASVAAGLGLAPLAIALGAAGLAGGLLNLAALGADRP